MRLFTALIAFALAFNLQAQFPNGGFENWTNLPGFDNPVVDPSGFFSSNDQYWFQLGLTPVGEVPGVSGSALHLETIEVEGEVSPSFAILGGAPDGEELLFPGGFPFADMNVTGISMDLNYDVDETSPAYVLVQFKLDGVPVTGGPDDSGTFFFPVSGTTPGFETTVFEFIPPITQTPDTVVVAFTSNDLLSEPPTGFVGDFIQIDNIAFTGTTEVVPGGDMDTWEPIDTPEVPDEWNTFTQFGLSTVVSSTDAFEGDLSALLTTIDNFGELSPGVMYQGTTNDYGIFADQPLPDDVVGFDFMYKYEAMPDDTALAFVVVSESLQNLENEIAFIGIPLVAAADWTAAQINWEWILDFLNPQYYAIVITSSNFDSENVAAGSQLWVDAFDYYLDPNSCSFDPQILEEPPILCPDEIGMFSVDEFDSYQWYSQLDGFPGEPEPIEGETGQTLEIDAENFAGYNVWCACTLDGCTEFTDPVLVDGWAFLPPAIASDGVNDICEGDSTILANAFGTYASYQWQNNGVDIEGATEEQYWVSESGSYTLVVSPAECPSFEMSNGVPVEITVHPNPEPTIIDSGGDFQTSESFNTYAWYSPNQNGTLISTNSSIAQNDPNIVGLSIQVLVTDEFGCEGWSEIFVWMGLGQTELTELSISPNPATNWIQIQTGSIVPKELELRDLTGQLVIAEQSGVPNQVLNISHLESGIYLLSLTQNGNTVTQRVVKL